LVKSSVAAMEPAIPSLPVTMALMMKVIVPVARQLTPWQPTVCAFPDLVKWSWQRPCDEAKRFRGVHEGKLATTRDCIYLIKLA
jgi:hypothetical protein